MPTLSVPVDAETLAGLVAELDGDDRDRFETVLAERDNRGSDTAPMPVHWDRIITPKETSPEAVVRLREMARQQHEAMQSLYEQWALIPDDPNETPFEELKANLNANRRATGERLLFPED